MKYKGYVVCQAVRKKFDGVKGIRLDHVKTTEDIGVIFFTKEDAYAYLSSVIEKRKKEVELGLREPWNLDPDKCLDFCVCETELIFDESRMIEKGWDLTVK